MRTFHIKSFIVICFIISSVLATEDPNASNHGGRRKQKYRIVKVYGRKLKSNFGDTAKEPPGRLEGTHDLENFDFPKVTHETQIPSTTPSFRTVTKSEVDDYEINKILNSPQFLKETNGELKENTPMIVQVSAPSSDSYLDPEYLGKLIREQLGDDAEFSVLPMSGTSGKASAHDTNTGIHNSQTSHPHKDYQNFETTTMRPSTTTTTTTIKPQNSHYSGRTLIPPTQDQTDTWTKYSNNKPKQSGRNYPHHPPANSEIQYPSYTTKPVATTTNPPPQRPVPDIKPPSIDPIFTNANHSNYHYTSYSTLSGELSVPIPGTAIPMGEYGTQTPEIEANQPLPGKYSTSFVRGFAHGNQDTTARPPSHPRPRPQIVSKGEPSYLRSTTTTISPPLPPPLPNALQLKTIDGTKYYYSKDPVQTFIIAPTKQPISVINQAFISYSPKPPKYTQTTQTKSYSSRQPQFHDTDVIDNYQATSGQHSKNYAITSTPKPFESYPIEYKTRKTEKPSYQYQSYSSTPVPDPAFYTHSTAESISNNFYSTSSPHNFFPQVEYRQPDEQQPYSPRAYRHNFIDSIYGSPTPEIQPQPETRHPLISKTIYVNLPPEKTTPTPKVPHIPVLPQRHYKIIFVKAPTQPPPEEPDVITTPAPISKTIIYVLHKKPDPPTKLVFPTQPPTLPSKPEVHFIQYREKPKAETKYAEENIVSSEEPASYDDEDYNNQQYNSQYNPYSRESEDTTGENDYRYSDQQSAYTYNKEDLHSSSSFVHVNVKKSISAKPKNK